MPHSSGIVDVETFKKPVRLLRLGMNLEQAPHQVRLARTGKAAFRRNAEVRYIIVSQGDTLFCAFDPISGVHESEINFGVGRKREFAHRGEEIVGGARGGHRQMDIGHLVRNFLRDRV